MDVESQENEIKLNNNNTTSGTATIVVEPVVTRIALPDVVVSPTTTPETQEAPIAKTVLDTNHEFFKWYVLTYIALVISIMFAVALTYISYYSIPYAAANNIPQVVYRCVNRMHSYQQPITRVVDLSCILIAGYDTNIMMLVDLWYQIRVPDPTDPDEAERIENFCNNEIFIRSQFGRFLLWSTIACACLCNISFINALIANDKDEAVRYKIWVIGLIMFITYMCFTHASLTNTIKYNPECDYLQAYLN